MTLGGGRLTFSIVYQYLSLDNQQWASSARLFLVTARTGIHTGACPSSYQGKVVTRLNILINAGAAQLSYLRLSLP